MGMVRLATVVLMILGAPVFAASVVTYELQLGGDNHADAIKAGTRWPGVNYSGGNVADGQYFTTGALNWAAVVAVSGNQSQPGHPSDGLAVQGLANFVLNLKLHSGSAGGPLATNVSYYSTIHSGTGALTCTDCAGGYTIPGPTAFCAGSAFAYVFNIAGLNWGYGTVLEALSSGNYTGPYMEVGMYPTVDVGNISGDGQLLGVGAGYGQWSRGGGFATLTTKGVGLASGLGVLPLVEGQIDTSLLAVGTYVLELVPGTGHNVLRGDVDLSSAPPPGNPEVQAFAVPANQVSGDTITFVVGLPPVLSVTPPTQGPLPAAGGATSFTVNITNSGGSYTSSTNDGAWLHITSGGSGTCPPSATLNVSADANGSPSPRTGTITVTAAGAQGSPQTVTVTQEAGNAPLALVSAASVKTHGTWGEFGVGFYPPSSATECRANLPATLVVTFNRAVFGSGGGDVLVDDLMLTADTSPAEITGVVTNGAVLRVSVSGVVSPDHIYLEFPGVFDSEGGQVGDFTCLNVVAGDVDGNTLTNTSDYIGVRGKIGQPVSSSNFRSDVNGDGNINTSDYITVRGKIGQNNSGC